MSNQLDSAIRGWHPLFSRAMVAEPSPPCRNRRHERPVRHAAHRRPRRTARGRPPGRIRARGRVSPCLGRYEQACGGERRRYRFSASPAMRSDGRVRHCRVSRDGLIQSLAGRGRRLHLRPQQWRSPSALIQTSQPSLLVSKLKKFRKRYDESWQHGPRVKLAIAGNYLKPIDC